MVAYDGSLLIHARTVIAAKNLLFPISKGADEPIGLRQLEEFLQFLDLYMLGTAIYYDYSIPKPIRDEADEAAGLLGQYTPISPLREDPDTFDAEVTNAMKDATPLIDEYLHSVREAKAATPTKQKEADAYFSYLNRISREKSHEAKCSLAQEALEKDLLGAKQLIALSYPENARLLARLTKIGKTATSEYRMDLHSYLINTFRYFLLTTWADRSQSMYVPQKANVGLGHKYRGLVWTALAKELGRIFRPRYLADIYERSSELVDETERVLPPLALFVLLTVPRGISPPEMLNRANDLAKKLGIKSKQKELVNLQLNYENEAELRDVVFEILGMWREEIGLEGLVPGQGALSRLVHEVTPLVLAAGAEVELKQTLGEVFQTTPPEDLWWKEALAKGIVRLLWSLGAILRTRQPQKRPRHIKILTRLSTLSSDVSMEEIERCVRWVWGRKLDVSR